MKIRRNGLMLMPRPSQAPARHQRPFRASHQASVIRSISGNDIWPVTTAVPMPVKAQEPQHHPLTFDAA